MIICLSIVEGVTIANRSYNNLIDCELVFFLLIVYLTECCELKHNWTFTAETKARFCTLHVHADDLRLADFDFYLIATKNPQGI